MHLTKCCAMFVSHPAADRVRSPVTKDFQIDFVVSMIAWDSIIHACWAIKSPMASSLMAEGLTLGMVSSSRHNSNAGTSNSSSISISSARVSKLFVEFLDERLGCSFGIPFAFSLFRFSFGKSNLYASASVVEDLMAFSRILNALRR